MPGLMSLGLAAARHRRNSKPPGFGGGVLGTGEHINSSDWNQGYTPPSNPNAFSDQNQYPVSMPGTSSLYTPPAPSTSRSTLPNAPGVGTPDIVRPEGSNPVHTTGHQPPGFGGGPFSPSQFSGLFNDESGNLTHSHDSAENNQYGYWGKDTYENPFRGFGGGGGGSGVDFGGGNFGNARRNPWLEMFTT